MSALPSPTVRLRLDALNPGHYLACCGALELADRCWRGAEGWFEEHADFFCMAPLEREASKDYSAKALLGVLVGAELSNTLMTKTQMQRLDALSARGKKNDKKRAPRDDPAATQPDKIDAEKMALELLWDKAKDDALHLGAPFGLRLDWYLDDRTGTSRFKTWAGQQNITDIAFELKNAMGRESFDDSETEWLFKRTPCDKSLFIDAKSDGTDIDIGFSFDPLGIGSPEKRPLVELLAFVGLQRFAPQALRGERAYMYAAWLDPQTSVVAQAAARGCGATPVRAFEFRLLYRSKYLKSFLPAQVRRDHP